MTRQHLQQLKHEDVRVKFIQNFFYFIHSICYYTTYRLRGESF